MHIVSSTFQAIIMNLALAILAAVSICAPEVAGGYFPKESDDFLMVIGGMIEGDDKIDTVELVSLDPAGNPVPECLKNLSSLPYRDFESNED